MKVGDRVVCVKAHGNPECGVKKGAIYTIRDVKQCSCGSIAFDVGIIGTSPLGSCRLCKKRYFKSIGIWWISARSFAPITYNSAMDELLNKEIVEEKADIQIKEPQI
jgi:hypothetical protein